MKTLNIDSGKQQYDLAGKVTVEFCPTDMDFVERIFSAFKNAEELYNKTEKEKREANVEKVFDICKCANQKMREIVNGVFGGVDVCTAIFETENIATARSNGFPLWANLLMAIMDECYDNLPMEEAATRARIDKYTKKYKKR